MTVRDELERIPKIRNVGLALIDLIGAHKGAAHKGVSQHTKVSGTDNR